MRWWSKGMVLGCAGRVPVASSTTSASSSVWPRSGGVTSTRCGARKLAFPRNMSTPSEERFERMRWCSCAVTTSRRPMSWGMVTAPESLSSRPNAPRPRACWMARAVSRSALEGMVPVLTQAPPGTASFSTIATRRPSAAACAAPRSPAGPLPTTTTS